MQFPFKLSVVEMKFYFFVVVSRLKRETWHKIFSISFSLFSTRLIIIVEDSFSFHRMESVMIKENKTVLCCTREKKFVQCFFTLSNIVSRVLRSREDSLSFEWLQTFLIELNLKTFNWNLESFSSLENFHNFFHSTPFFLCRFQGEKRSFSSCWAEDIKSNYSSDYLKKFTFLILLLSVFLMELSSNIPPT